MLSATWSPTFGFIANCRDVWPMFHETLPA